MCLFDNKKGKKNRKKKRFKIEKERGQVGVCNVFSQDSSI